MFAITQVLESRNVNYVKNDIVIGMYAQDYCITDEKIFNKVDNDSYSWNKMNM